MVLFFVLSNRFLPRVLDSPDGKLANTLAWLPFWSRMVMPLRMSTISMPPWEIGASLLALVAGCYIAVWVAARIYQTGLLLYGKRPSMVGVTRWVRYQ